MDLVNNILLSGLGASLGGAIAGGFFGSFLQIYYSNRSIREKDHLSDLKRDVVDPIIGIISSPNFTLANFQIQFSDFRYEGGAKLESNDVLFQDFMIDHYPNIHSQLKTVIGSCLELANKQHQLSEALRSSLSNVFSNIAVTTDRQSKNDKSIDTLCQAILNNDYNQSYMRTTDYVASIFLYFYPVEDSRIPFSNDKTNLIFSSAELDKVSNIRQVDSVKSVLIQGIDAVINQMSKEIEDHNKSKNAFSNKRKQLLHRLLEVKYSTKLKFEKKTLKKLLIGVIYVKSFV
jgi:hypothetical protein